MSNIIKSASVVDERPDADRFVVRMSEPDTDMPVIKRQVLGGRLPAPIGRLPCTRDAALDELNRVRVQIEDARKELRAANRELEDLRKEVEKLWEQQESLAKLDGLTIDDQAKAILKDAERQAEQMMNWAKQQASESVDRLKTQGYLDGLEQGATEAREQYRAEHAPGIGKLERLLQEVSNLRDEMIQQNEHEIVELIIAVAGRVIGKRQEDDPKMVVDMLRDVLEQNRREAFVKITISPDLMPAETKVSDSVRKAIQALGQQIDILVDSEAVPGTLVVETPKGYTDLSVSTQLENLHEALLDPS